jgi:hypothetical protein
MTLSKHNREFRRCHKAVLDIIRLCNNGKPVSLKYIHLLTTAEQFATHLYEEINHSCFINLLATDGQNMEVPVQINADLLYKITNALHEAGHNELIDDFNRQYAIYKPAVKAGRHRLYTQARRKGGADI